MPYVETHLGRWFYEERGQARREGGATLVLLSSLLCDGGMWRHQVGPLEALGRVVVFDHPGHGQSDVPPAFTLDDHVRALTQALGALFITRVLLVGLSWGGMLGMRLALAEPELLAGMVLLDTSADGTVLRDRLEYRALCLLARAVGLPPWLIRRKIAPLMFGAHTLAHQPKLADDFVRTLAGFSPLGIVRATKAVSIDRRSIVPSLRRLRVPTLVGVGEQDTATPPSQARRIASHIPDATLVYFENAGHLSALEAPEEVNAAILPFVRAHLARP